MTDDGVTNTRVQVATPADLAAAREARGMSQVDISQRIKLQVRQVNALEEGQWDALPGKSFVRGALRSYGKLLEVDVTPLLESIGGFAEPTQVQALRPLNSAMSRSSGLNGGSRSSPILWVIAGLVGVVALVLYFGSDQETSRIRSWLPSGKAPAAAPAEPAPRPEPAVTPAPGVTVSPGPVASGTAQATAASGGTAAGGPSGTAGSSDNGSPAASAGSGPVISAISILPRADTITAPSRGANGTSNENPVSNSGAVTPDRSRQATGSNAAEAAAQIPAPGMSDPGAAVPVKAAGEGSPTAGVEPVARTAGATGKGVIRLKAVQQDSWSEVRQADGTPLHNGLIKAGESIELTGKPPYRLVLGNASHVELVYEGKVQDLAPHMRANNIARLQLK